MISRLHVRSKVLDNDAKRSLLCRSNWRASTHESAVLSAIRARCRYRDMGPSCTCVLRQRCPSSVAQVNHGHRVRLRAGRGWDIRRLRVRRSGLKLDEAKGRVVVVVSRDPVPLSYHIKGAFAVDFPLFLSVLTMVPINIKVSFLSSLPSPSY